MRGGATHGKTTIRSWERERTEKKKVVKEERKHERKKTCINKPYFPSLLTNPLFRIPKVVTSSHLGSFSKMHNFNGKSLCQDCSSWGLSFFLVHFLRKDSTLDFDCKYI